MEYLSVGKITQTFGIKGEVKVYVTSSFSLERFKKNNTLYIKFNDEYLKLKIERSYQKDANFYIVKFFNYDDATISESLKNNYLYVEKDPSILKDNEYFYVDLIGLDVLDENQRKIGVIEKIEEFPAQITLKIKFNDKFYYVPFNDFFIKDVNLKDHYIKIHVIDGLI